MEHAVRLFRSTREWLAPVPTETAFLERGVITPEEFVRAGDHLISCCPSWSWEEGEPQKSKDYLPKRKQFLVTRGVPCIQRVSLLLEESSSLGANETETSIDEENNGWLIPESNGSISKGGIVSAAQKESAFISSSSDCVDEYVDMEEYGDLALDDSSVQKPSSIVASTTAATTTGGRGGGIRRYDLSITYDKYYQTPRIWLYGWNNNGSPLTTDEVFEDVFQDYAKKTVTIEPHPHLSEFHASVHPCKHGDVMKSMIDHLIESDQVPSIDQYLFIFLKLIQSMVPTIEYDYTVSVHIKKKQNAT
jgi:ubiquitin-like-conjugating enzyme ATG3